MNKDLEREPLTQQHDVNASNPNNTEDLNNQLKERKKKYLKYGLIGIGVLIALVLCIALPIALSNKKKPEPSPSPDPKPTDTPAPTQTPVPSVVPVYPPQPNNDVSNYEVDSTTITNTLGTFGGTLKLPAPAAQRLEAVGANYSNTEVSYGGANNKMIQNVNFSFSMIDFETAFFSLTPADESAKRFSIPEGPTNIGKGSANPSMKLKNVGFSYSLNPFSFSFSNPADTEDWYVSTEGKKVAFLEKYIQLDMALPSVNLFGFGERNREFGIKQGTYTMWASGSYNQYDGLTGRMGTYGVHPFVLVQSGKNKGRFFGIFFRNSNAQSPVVNIQNNQSTLSYITTGGQLEVYFFMQGTPQKVIQAYQSLVGKPQLPPFWSLGWGQASQTLNTQDLLQQLIADYQSNSFPLEVVYLGQDAWLSTTQDFSVNTTNFHDFSGLRQILDTNNQKLVLQFNSGVSALDTSSKYYQDGNTNNLFIQSTVNNDETYGTNLVSKLASSGSNYVFVDWFHPYAYTFLENGLRDLYSQVKFNGVWLESNEITTAIDGEITKLPPKPETPTETTQELSTQPNQAPKMGRRSNLNSINLIYTDLQEENNYVWFESYDNKTARSANDTFYLPFIVTGIDPLSQPNWDRMALSLNATHPGFNSELEYNLHNLNGHMSAKTYWGVIHQQNKDIRPFVLAKGTFSGTGQYASHWTGDNYRTWNHLKYSIAGVMNMNLLGVTHTGADVCGYNGNKRDDDLCFRWIQLSTFYPLARANDIATFNGTASESQLPYLLGGNYKGQARTAIFDRYSYLRFMYTCLFQAHQDGGSCIQPTFFSFPTDEQLYVNTEETFMVDGKVLVTPVLSSNLAVDGGAYNVYFPKGIWASLVNSGEVIDRSNAGSVATIKSQARVNAYLRDGAIVPIQDNSNQMTMTTTDLVKRPIALYVNRDSAMSAVGTLFLDGGVSMSELENKDYEFYEISYQANSLQVRIKDGNQGNQNHTLEKVVILNAADMSLTDFACSLGGTPYFRATFEINYDNTAKTLVLTPSAPVKINQLRYLYFGSTKQNDPNLCSADVFKYKVDNESEVDLNQQQVSFSISHKSGTLPPLQVNLRYVDQGIVNIKWGYKQQSRQRTHVEVPQFFVNTAGQQSPVTGGGLNLFVTVEMDPFSISVKSRNAYETEPFFNISNILYDDYLNIVRTKLKTLSGDNFTGIFGLGERASKDFFYKDGVYTLWSKDSAATVENGKQPTKGLYSAHPFYMFRHNYTSWVGVYSNVAQAQDWWVRNDQEAGSISLSQVTTGSITDLYVFLDQQKPDKILERYYTLIGKPTLIPQWALGWHQCKWGYTSTQDLVTSVERYKNNSIPLEAQWVDIDYMDAEYDFTLDTSNFAGLKDFVDGLHKESRKFVPIVDAGVAYRPNQSYSVYDSASDPEKNIFLKVNNSVFVGKVWPNAAVYPDFTNQNTTSWWHQQLDAMYQLFNFDGLWLDMNEPSNFCVGFCDDTKITNSIGKNLNYIPGGASLEQQSLPLDVIDSNGNYFLDTHSLYGATETKSSSEWFTRKSERTFIIERSSFAGMGKYGSKWLGDNEATPAYMSMSVSGVMLMNIFGIPFVGADICGFMLNTTPELCARWHNLGSFYPFSRNHNDAFRYREQDPVAFGDEEYETGVTYQDIMKTAIKRKYSLVRYYYTQLFLMSTEAQKTFIKPMFFVFPEDQNAYQNITQNIMIGDQLKLSINVDTFSESSTNYLDTSFFYFPSGVWCNILNPTDKCLNSAGQAYELSSKAYDVYAHIKAGSIIPYQSVTDEQTTADLQKKPVDFHIVGVQILDNGNWRAEGVYINDDGTNLTLTDNYNSYSLVAEGKYSGSVTISEKITFKIFPLVTADNFFNKETGVYDVNANDQVGSIYIYNANSFNKASSYSVTTVDNKGLAVNLGEAALNQQTNRIEFTAGSAFSLSSYQVITYTPITQ